MADAVLTPTEAGSDGLVITGGSAVAMDARRTVRRLDIIVDQRGRIDALVAPGAGPKTVPILDVTGLTVVPGLIQGHVRLAHTLFRGLEVTGQPASWLQDGLGALEAAHNAASVRAAARLGIAQLLLSGTTAVLDMALVHNTDALFQAARDMGLRYAGGKAMMDATSNVAGTPASTPPESTTESLRESDRLAERWHGSQDGRLRYAYSPRSVLTCSLDLLRSTAARTQAHDLLVQIQAGEHPVLEAEVVGHQGQSSVSTIAESGLLGTDTVLAPAIGFDAHDVGLIARAGTSVVITPSASLRLGAGIGPAAIYLDAGVNVGLGSGSPAASASLDAWTELRTAALLDRLAPNPAPLTSIELFEMTTVGGARALGLDGEVGSIEPGKFADLAILDLRRATDTGLDDVYSQLVLGVHSCDVRTVLVHGNVLVHDGKLTRADYSEIIGDARRQLDALRRRAGWPVAPVA